MNLLISKNLRPALLLLAIVPVARAELRDPTLPPPAPTLDASTQEIIEKAPTLMAVWSGSGGKRAMIDGITVKAGQTVLDDIKVLKINTHSVIVRWQGKSQTLYIAPPIKKSVK